MRLDQSPEYCTACARSKAFIGRKPASASSSSNPRRAGTDSAWIVVHEARELESRLLLWMEQLRRNYGEVILFAERYLEGARHIVVPFVRFVDGRSETSS